MGKKTKTQPSKTQQQHYQVFISGIPYECEQQELLNLFDRGSIDKVKLPRYQDTGRCLGYAHIGFDNKEAYEQALSKNGVHMGKRYLSITPAQGQKHPPETKQVSVPVGCKVLFVKNLPYEISQQEIRAVFGACGIITDVRMVRNWANKQFKGFSYIDYRDLGSVKKAITKFHNKEFKGRKLILDAVTTQQKKGFKKRDWEKNQEKQQQ